MFSNRLPFGYDENGPMYPPPWTDYVWLFLPFVILVLIIVLLFVLL